jgi:C4-dicarboxylate-specific signal transduction histidine kinase
MSDFRKQGPGFWPAVVQCLSGILALVFITFICYTLHLQTPTVTCLYLIVIVLLARRGNFASSVIVSFFAVACLDYYFVLPLFSFNVRDPSDIAAIVTFLTASAVITQLVSRVRGLMQEQLQQSEAYLSEAQQLSHTGSFGWRVSTGELRWSDETFRIFQLDRAVKPNLDLVFRRTHPEDEVLVKQTIEQAAQTGKDFDFEHRLLMLDTSVKYLRVVAHVTKDKWGGFEFFGAVMDITANKRGEEALRQAQAELAHVTRRTTMGELAASIAHEVNQPLAGIVMNGNASLRWMAADPPNLDEAREAIQRVIRDGKRAGDVIARIRTLFKKANKVREQLDINEAIQEVLVLMRNEMQRNSIALRLHLADGLPPVLGDKVQIQQVLMNLILNAIEAMNTVEHRIRKLVIKTSVNGDEQVRVEVQDWGVGFDPEGAEKIFDSFHTTKPAGMGMGLSISRSIVENHAGRLWATPNNGPGVTFQFTLSTQSPSAQAPGQP